VTVTISYNLSYDPSAFSSSFKMDSYFESLNWPTPCIAALLNKNHTTAPSKSNSKIAPITIPAIAPPLSPCEGVLMSPAVLLPAAVDTLDVDWPPVDTDDVGPDVGPDVVRDAVAAVDTAAVAADVAADDDASVVAGFEVEPPVVAEVDVTGGGPTAVVDPDGVEDVVAAVVPNDDDGGVTDDVDAAALVTVRGNVVGGVTGRPWSLTH